MTESSKLRDLKSFIKKADALNLIDLTKEEKIELARKLESPESVKRMLNNLKKRMPKDLDTFNQ